MTVSRAQLEEAACSFATDRVKDSAMTEFKQDARYRQHQWAATSQGITQFGTHRNTKKGIDAGRPAVIDNGTKLTPEDAAAGRNFLSDGIIDAVEDRIEHPQKDQTFDVTRLRGDLLSSMPMAFNLFGEAARHEESKQALSALLAPGAVGPAEIVFEWSPGRRNDKYTRDRTAFDVALQIGTGPRTVVGIETKYHEHSQPEKKPNSEQQLRYQTQTDFLVQIAEMSGAFISGWQDKVLTTDLRQIWRDHLLALAMRQHPDEWTTATRYVLIYPRANVSYELAATQYAKLLQPGDDSFSHLKIEDILDAAFAHAGPTKERFRDRYLW